LWGLHLTLEHLQSERNSFGGSRAVSAIDARFVLESSWTWCKGELSKGRTLTSFHLKWAATFVRVTCTLWHTHSPRRLWKVYGAE
jgi:hypothetical protein